MINLRDANYCPAFEEIEEYVRNPLFGRFCSTLKENYKAKEQIDFSKCCMEPGWNVKLKKSGKSLCTIYPRESYFTVMVVVGRKEKEAAELFLTKACEQLREIYERTEEGNGQRWLMIDMEDEGRLYEDVLTLIGFRVGK